MQICISSKTANVCFLRKAIRFITVIFFLGLLSSCASYQVDNKQHLALYSNTPIAILSFNNNTQTPDANDAVSAIVTDLLRAKGFNHLIIYHRPAPGQTTIPGLETPPTLSSQIAFARAHGAAYALYGSVNEWNYKVGLDSAPVAGVSLELIDLNQHRVVWSAVGSMSGSSRQGLAVAGQNLLTMLMQNMSSGQR